jgi:hypothetical protein
MSPRSDPTETRFVEPPSGGLGVGCAFLFVGFPTIGFVISDGFAHPDQCVRALVLLVVVLGGAYWLFSDERAATLDERGLRLTSARVLFGRRVRERVLWEISASSLTHAREVHTRRPAKNGGWNHRTRLELPEGRTLDAIELGGHENGQSAYSRLVRALKKQLGAGFERVDPHP